MTSAAILALLAVGAVLGAMALAGAAFIGLLAFMLARLDRRLAVRRFHRMRRA
jgi:uncharacterized membrane protein